MPTAQLSSMAPLKFLLFPPCPPVDSAVKPDTVSDPADLTICCSRWTCEDKRMSACVVPQAVAGPMKAVIDNLLNKHQKDMLKLVDQDYNAPHGHERETNASKMESQVRQNYHRDSEAAVNRMINMKMFASYTYTSMVRDDTCFYFNLVERIDV
ncbi:Ferritin, middle subunit [Liparis tanakae]|uniref:Ferritin, middle subunit n=1 Tax=Liparis tanakae TaxID=230148 RepID=A0A4Z2EIN0_9TELE|nr:Ferritin, middle subunit [Liparis tanakae]